MSDNPKDQKKLKIFRYFTPALSGRMEEIPMLVHKYLYRHKNPKIKNPQILQAVEPTGGVTLSVLGLMIVFSPLV